MHTTDCAVGDQPLRFDHFGEKAMHEADLQIDAATLRGIDDPIARGDAARHRLLQQDRLARLRRGDRDRLVRVVRCANDDGRDVVAIEGRAPIGQHISDTEPRGQRRRPLTRAADKCADLGTRHARQRNGRRDPAKVILGDEACAKHRDTDGLHHAQTLKRPCTLTNDGSTAASGAVYV